MSRVAACSLASMLLFESTSCSRESLDLIRTPTRSSAKVLPAASGVCNALITKYLTHCRRPQNYSNTKVTRGATPNSVNYTTNSRKRSSGTAVEAGEELLDGLLVVVVLNEVVALLGRELQGVEHDRVVVVGAVPAVPADDAWKSGKLSISKHVVTSR